MTGILCAMSKIVPDERVYRYTGAMPIDGKWASVPVYWGHADIREMSECTGILGPLSIYRGMSECTGILGPCRYTGNDASVPAILGPCRYTGNTACVPVCRGPLFDLPYREKLREAEVYRSAVMDKSVLEPEPWRVIWGPKLYFLGCKSGSRAGSCYSFVVSALYPALLSLSPEPFVAEGRDVNIFH